MAKLVINTNFPDNLISVGNSANDRRGDPLRTAFSKINDAFDNIDANFTELYSNPVSSGATISTGATPPSTPAVGDLWYDTVGGRTYVFYDNNWIDANPIAAPNPTLTLQTPPSANYGAVGDTKGMIAIDDIGAFYYCFKNYTDGQGAIWSKIPGNFGW